MIASISKLNQTIREYRKKNDRETREIQCYYNFSVCCYSQTYKKQLIVGILQPLTGKIQMLALYARYRLLLGSSCET